MEKNSFENMFKQSDGIMIREMIGKREDLGGYTKFSFTKVIIKQGYEDRKHYHRCCDELYYVVQGMITLTVDDTPRLLQEGECFLVECGEQHYIKCVKDTAELLVICSPAWDERDCYYI